MATAALVRNEGPRRGSEPESDARGDRRLRRRVAARPLLVAACLTVLVGSGAIWRAAAVDVLGAGTGPAQAGGATLHLSSAYAALSPICELYDALTLLTLSQHAALLAWFVALAAANRLVRRLRPPLPNASGARLHHDASMFVTLLGITLVVYAIGALAPRPMAALVLPDRDELAVDIHSHTSSSHDGRPGFDAEANRRWHAAAGFAAAYITDHRNFDGATAGVRGNPRRAGDGTVLLSGIESAEADSRLTLLGATLAKRVDRNGRADIARLEADTTVVAVLTTPASLGRIPAGTPLVAVEASDGAPRGLMFTRRLAPEIGRFARARGLAEVAGSNNHGWGRTASAWTVLRIPGWQAMTPASLDSAIRSVLRHPGSSVRVVARGSTPIPRSAAALVATPALVVWNVVTRLATVERLSWLAWIWAIAAMVLLARRRDSGAGAVWPKGGVSFAARAPRSPRRGRRAALRGR